MITANTILDVARAEIGTKATNYRKCKYNTWFYGNPVSGSEYHWCAVFVVWCFNRAKALNLIAGSQVQRDWIPEDGLKYASCGYLAEVFQKRGQLIKPATLSVGLSASQAKAGDIVFFHWGYEHSTLIPGTYVSDHVGIIEKVNTDGTITTIEGNTGNSANGEVLRQVRDMNYVSCLARPAYGKQETESVQLKFYYVGKTKSAPAGQVKTIQRLLNWLKYPDQNGKELNVDGVVGSCTDYAIKSYQKKHNLPVTGIVNDKMWKMITAGK